MNMNTRKAPFIFLAAVALSGCAGDAQIRAQVAGANVEIARAQARAIEQPLVDIAMPCPIGYQCGPNGFTIVVRNPQAKPDYVAAPDDPWARVADRAMGAIGTLGGVWLGGRASAEIIGAVGGVVTGGLTAAGAGGDGGVGAVANVANHALTTQATAVQGALDTMPPPVVVPQPAPLVVQQPAPLVVPQPTPVIVHPEVVYPGIFYPPAM